MRRLSSIDPSVVTIDDVLPAWLERASDRHAAGLGRVATVLTDDAELAAGLVARALVACGSATGDTGLPSLSAHVATSWLGGPVTSGTSGRAPHDACTPDPLLRDVRGLPDDQRTLLALCRFGAHTYREAADVLGLAPGDAARLLTSALRSLRTTGTTADGPAATT